MPRRGRLTRRCRDWHRERVDMVRRASVQRCVAAAIAVVALLIAARDGGARPTANICATLGLTPGSVQRADHVIRETADQRGRPQCVLVTRKGTVYITLYPASAAKDLQTSWAFDLSVTTESPSGLGSQAVSMYTAGHRQEALGFVRSGRYVWMNTASRYAHAELLSLAATIYAKL
jgi:hypothetical protein